MPCVLTALIIYRAQLGLSLSATVSIIAVPAVVGYGSLHGSDFVILKYPSFDFAILNDLDR